MIKIVENFIKENNLLNKHILLGLSGGVDSSTLADILSKINVKVTVIHLNHNWRGMESKRDELFAKKTAEKLGFDFYTETLKSDIKKTETSAREERYKFFERAYKKLKADAVFLAHNKNDNIETLIYRLIKGTGPKGLNSIPKIRDIYYRPLLDISREEIEKYAKENKVEYIIDSSNTNTKYKRNLIREKILPLMKEINPEVINSISTFIKINEMNQNIVDNVISDKTIEKRDEFLSYNKEIQYELINRNLKGIIKTRDFKTIKKIVDFIKKNSSSKISLGENLFLKVYDNKIYFLKNSNKKEFEEINLKEGINKFSNYIITIIKTDTPKDFPKNKYVNLDFNNQYTIRTRKEGDIICPFGSNSNQKLKTYFIKKKIPSEIRDEIPLIALKNEILYIPDICISEKLRVDKTFEKCYKINVERIDD